VHQLNLLLILWRVVEQVLVCGQLFWWRPFIVGHLWVALNLYGRVSGLLAQRKFVYSQLSVPAIAVPRLVVVLVLVA